MNLFRCQPCGHVNVERSTCEFCTSRFLDPFKIHITNFVRRQTPESGFTHWNLTDDELIARVAAGFRYTKQGYRDGVELVPIASGGIFSSIVKLEPGDKLVGEYAPRRAGETPRKSTYSLKGEKIPAQRVDVVLYSHAVLAEKNENETDADYEIVSVNGSPTDASTPLSVGTLIANHFELDGGTATKMTDSEFVAKLRESVYFWSNKANAAPQHLKG